MRSITILFAAASAAIAFTNSVSLAQHADVKPYVSNNKIVTGGIDDSNPNDPLPAEIRVFGFDFGENAGQPYFVQDPGFNALAGSGLPGGSQLAFNVVGPLRYWNGTGAEPTFGATPSGETLAISLGAENRVITSSTTQLAGFTIQTVASSGAVHQHFNSFLLGSDGNSTPGDGVEPTAGIYAYALELTSSNNGIAKSLPLYIVFNNGLSEELHDAAIDTISATLVPEPTTLAAMPTIGLLLKRRRRPIA